MGMVVRTNTMAMNANRQLGVNNTQVGKSLEKLSSGFRINRAADDASGLAISEKMKAQIKGLEQASANSQDGISLIQTAEGATTEIHNMLNRMIELATKSANGTIQNEVDREAIQREVDDLNAEITRIAQSTNFNGINLLDGTLSGNGKATGSGLTGGVVFDYKAATTGATAANDFSTNAAWGKETVKIDGVDVEIDWSKLTSDDKAALTIDWTTGATADNVKKAASVLQAAINNAIKDTNKSMGTNVSEITVKGTEAGSAGSFEIVSGLNGNAKSSIEITASGTAGHVLQGLMAAPGAGGSFDGGTVAAAPTVTIGGTAAALTDVDWTSATGADTATKLNGKTLSVTINGVTKSVTFTTDAADSNTVIGVKTDASKNFKGVFDAAVAALQAQFTADATTAAAGTADYSAYTALSITGTNNAALTAASATKTDYVYTPGAGTDVSAAATNKFKGDVAEINGVNFDMVIGGEKINVNVTGLENDGATGNQDDTNNATALKTAIDAALDNYATAKGMSAADQATLKANLTVAVNKNGQFEITNNTGMRVSFEDKDGGKAAQLLGISGSGQAVSNGGLTLQVGDTNEDYNKVTVSVDDLSADGIGTAGLNVSNEDAAGNAIQVIRNAINQVSTNRANLGSLQNRLEYTINNLDTTAENMTAANSRIRDTDMAKEMMNYTKMNILTQAAQAMLAQANQQPQAILQLLQ